MTSWNNKNYSMPACSDTAGFLFINYFIFKRIMEKVFAYIDGFNVYHSLNAYIKNNNLSNELKWLDIKSVVSFFVNKQFEILENVAFFSAIPTHLKIDKQNRHINYYNALKSIGIEIVDGKFGKKKFKFICKNCHATNIHYRCHKCGKNNDFISHEEKESDVSLAIKIISDILTIKELNKIILVSSDTDFIPVVNYILNNTNKKIIVLFPLGSSKSNKYRDIKNKNYKLKEIKEFHINKSSLPDIINFNGKIYKNPYKQSDNKH